MDGDKLQRLVLALFQMNLSTTPEDAFGKVSPGG